MASAILDQLDTFGPERCRQLSYDQAVAYNRDLARTHYENFTVVSWLLPRRLRDDFRNVYAFCRWADDLGDETGDPGRSLELLDWWRRELDLCYADNPRHPVFVALRQTILRHDVPRKPFDDLIDAFVQDQHVTRYDTWDQVLDYCTRSADPVGRLVLYLSGYRDAQRQALSDATCTALQLANFWQDVRRDVLERNRVYMPRDVALRHGLEIDDMVKAIQIDAAGERMDRGCNCAALPSLAISALLPPYRATIRDLTQRTWVLFAQGRQLWPTLDRQIRPDVKLFTLGGESILRMIEANGYNTMARRPKLHGGRKLALVVRAAAGKLMASMAMLMPWAGGGELR
jgi:squalene synthase HpnC